ncbi:MAG: hypothetical protein LBU68_01950 [Rickettsiales bacterium]|jgi:amino acid permease|nr:hypothetical protein [Rickettsiales bacterium]
MEFLLNIFCWIVENWNWQTLGTWVIGCVAIYFAIKQHQIEKHKKDDFRYEKRFEAYLEYERIIHRFKLYVDILYNDPSLKEVINNEMENLYLCTIKLNTLFKDYKMNQYLDKLIEILSTIQAHHPAYRNSDPLIFSKAKKQLSNIIKENKVGIKIEKVLNAK